MRYSKGTRVYTLTNALASRAIKHLTKAGVIGTSYYEARETGTGVTGTVVGYDETTKLYQVQHATIDTVTTIVTTTCGVYYEDELIEALQLPFEQLAFDNSLIKWIDNVQK